MSQPTNNKSVRPAIRTRALAATTLAAFLGVGLVGCGIEDFNTTLPDEPISQEEIRQGDQAVQAIETGGNDPAFDLGQADESTDGTVAHLAPLAREPSNAQVAADAQIPELSELVGEEIATGTPDPTTERFDETTAAPTDHDRDPTTGTSVQNLAACRGATGYIRGRSYRICVTTIDGKLVGNRTAQAYVRMRAAARNAGVRLYIVSGFRTMAQQRYLYNLYLQGRGNLAARPGYSNHQSGIALDLNASASGVYRWLSRNARRFGFRRTVPSENWHWEYRP